MYGARYEFFARATFTENQDRCARARYECNRLHEFAHNAARVY